MTEVTQHSTKFKARVTGGVRAVFKATDAQGNERFITWGPASVEIVDKEDDKITAQALKEALPQLLRRKRTSWQHSDQLVGDILESFETDEPQTVQFNGIEVTRKEFPTDVLELDEMEKPALFVCSEVWDDTRASRTVREKIEAGEIDSYSISGEAIQSKTKVAEDRVYDEITELDLSAVTYCEEGMNQRAKFGTVVKNLTGSDDPVSPESGQASSPPVNLGKSQMSNDNDGGLSKEEREQLRADFEMAAKDAIDEADFATKEEVNDLRAKVEELEAESKAPDDDEQPEEDPEEEGGDLDEVDPDDIEDPDDDGEAELDVPGDEDDEVEAADDEPEPDVDDDEPVEDEPVDPDVPDDDEGPEDNSPDVVAELENADVPDDLVESVKEHLGSDEVEPADANGDVIEAEDDDDGTGENAPPDDQESLPVDNEDADDEQEHSEKSPVSDVDGGDMDKAATAQADAVAGPDADVAEYNETTVSALGPVPEDDLQKSFDISEEDGDDVEVGGSQALSAFYKNVEGEEV